MKAVLSIFLLLFTVHAAAQTAPLIRFGRGFAAEEQLWLMSARPDLTPNQGKRYELKQILFQANPEAVRAFLADYVAVTKYYLANVEQAKRDIHKAGFVRTPIEIYLKNADWKRDPGAGVDVGSLKKLATIMQEKLGWLEKPVNVDDMVDQTFLPR